MNLRKLYLTKNECYIVGKKHTPKGIMVHSTAANNPWLKRYVGPDDGLLGKNPNNNHWNQFRPGGRQVCVHAFIGKLADGTIATYQTLPWDMVGWHSGSGTKGNAGLKLGYIGFEICEDNLTDRNYFNAVYKEAVELCAYLCKLYNIPPEKPYLICHSEGYKLGIASNHGDVMHWFPKHGKSMDTFRADVKKLLEQQTTNAPRQEDDDNMTQEQFNKMMDNYLAQLAKQEPNDWSKEERKWAESLGIIKGDQSGQKQYKAFTTREQMVTFLYRIYNKLNASCTSKVQSLARRVDSLEIDSRDFERRLNDAEKAIDILADK